MSEDKKDKNTILEKLKNKYRLVIFNDRTFKEVGTIKINRLNFIFGIGFFFLIFILTIWSSIAYTPLRELVPGYPDVKMRNNIIQSKIRLDSLEMEIKYRDQYFSNLNAVIRGDKPEDFLTENINTMTEADLNVIRSEADSILRHDIEIAEKLSIPVSFNAENNLNLENLHFFSPVNGLVTNSFNPMANHFGTDVVAGPNEVVKATLDGTVTMATWTLETGYVLQIQHDNNLISVYKHNAELLKKVGTRIKAGDAIAIIGNSGELTTGPHLHFEIWQNGVALNPEELIVF